MEMMEIYKVLADEFTVAIEPSPEGLVGDPFVVVDSGMLHEVLEYLKNNADMAMDQLKMISGVDRGDCIEVVYHLYSYKHFHAATIKAKLSVEIPEVDTATDLWGAAEWHERETYDMLGVVFLGHENLRRILLPDDWEGFPLRKNYKPAEQYHGLPNVYEQNV